MDLTQLIKFYEGKKILVTGHTGFKGSWLCEILLKAGANVYGYALLPQSESLYNILKLDSKVDSCYQDIRALEFLKKFILEIKPDLTFHLAAQPLVLEGYKNPVDTFSTNIMGTVNVLESTRNLRNKCSVVIVTTDKVYLNREWEWGYREYERLDGHDPYSNSKSCSELVTASYIRSFFYKLPHISVSTARAGNVIGGGDFADNRIIPDCVRGALSKHQIIVRNPNSIRPYQHVLEPLFAYLLLAKNQYEDKGINGSYNVGPGNDGCYSTRQLVEAFIKFWGEGLEWIHPESGIEIPHEANFLKLDNTKIRTKLGWHPVWNLDQTMKSIVDWTKAWRDKQDMKKITDIQIEKFIKDANNFGK